MLLTHVLSLFGAGLAAASQSELRDRAPHVAVKDGTLIGQTDGTVDTFNGIPFAEPPVGSLRLRPPKAITKPYGTVVLPKIAKACPQQTGPTALNPKVIPPQILKLLKKTGGPPIETQSEDCLTLDISRPAGTARDAKLPVVFWIYGGGFEAGATQSYNATDLVSKGIDLKTPVIYVAVNYRLSGFGWLAGKEIQKDGSTNLGMRDQRMGLEWVAENIAAFGGDPEKVVIWGESAGSISVYNQLIVNKGNNLYKGKPLFRGAIMDSGTATPALTVTNPKAQAVYDEVVAAAGCSGKADTLECLRSISYHKFLAAIDAQPNIFSYQGLGLSFMPRPDPSSDFYPVSPEVAVRRGNFAKVPVIIGDQEDEGTLFSLVQSNVTTTDDLITYANMIYTDTPRKVIAGLVHTYPDDPSYGSPFRTGSKYNWYPQYKRLAALQGDTVFTLTRRIVLSEIVSQVPCWSYLATYHHHTHYLGTFHGSDVSEAYDRVPKPTVGDIIQTYYISFVNSLDPNAITTAAPLTRWPNWKENSRQLIDIKRHVVTLRKDDFRESNYRYIREHQSQLRS